MSYDCDHYKDLIADLVTGALDETQSSILDEHLRDCEKCQGYKEALEQEDKLLSQYVDMINDKTKDSRQKLIDKINSNQYKQNNNSLKWRYIMKSPVTKFSAVAAVILIALSVGVIPLLTGSVTFAKVVQPILDAKTVILDMNIGSGQDGLVMHEVVVDSRIRRTLSNMPNLVQVLDLDSGKMLVLDEEARTAVYVEIQGTVQEGTKHYVKFLRQLIRNVQGGEVDDLGKDVIDGREVIGYHGKNNEEEVTIWADAKTLHPVLVEVKIGKGFPTKLRNFKFNEPVDKALVSLDVPDGYTLKEQNMDMSNATEDDFVQSLGIWAEMLYDNTFPEEIGSEMTMKMMPRLVEALKLKNVTEQQGVEMSMKVARSMVFHQMLDVRGAKWNYSGGGVKLGDAETIVFWYQPKDSQAYRVVYGDLSVKDSDTQP